MEPILPYYVISILVIGISFIIGNIISNPKNQKTKINIISLLAISLITTLSISKHVIVEYLYIKSIIYLIFILSEILNSNTNTAFVKYEKTMPLIYIIYTEFITIIFGLVIVDDIRIVKCIYNYSIATQIIVNGLFFLILIRSKFSLSNIISILLPYYMLVYIFYLIPFVGYYSILTYIFAIHILFIPFWFRKLSNLSSNTIQNQFLLGTSLALGWIVIEAGLRFSYPELKSYTEANLNQPYIPLHLQYTEKNSIPFHHQNSLKNKNLEIKFNDITYRYNGNSRGFNDREWPLPQQLKGYKTWLLLGDSFTEGVGSYPDSTWGRFIEERLRKSTGDSSIVCLNAGFSGADPVISAALAERLIPEMQPRVVVWAINQTDIREVALRGPMEQRLQPKMQKLFEYGYGFSYLFRFIFVKLLGFNEDGIHNSNVTTYQQTGIAIIQSEIDRIHKICLKNAIQLLVFAHPLQDEIKQHHAFLPWNEHFTGTQSLFPCFNAKIHPSLPSNFYFWPIDRHHTPAGYALMAECIYESLPDSLKRPLPKDRQ